MLAELASVDEHEVHLITAVAVGLIGNDRCLSAIQDALLQILKRRISESLQRRLVVVHIRIIVDDGIGIGDVEVSSGTSAVLHAIYNVLHLDAVVMAVTHVARVSEFGMQALQRTPDAAQVSLQRTLDRHGVRLLLAVVDGVIETLVVVVILERRVVLHARVVDGITIDLVGDIRRVLHHVEIVFLVTAAAVTGGMHILVRVVARYRKRGFQEFGYIGGDTGTIVPTVVVEFSDVTVLRLIRNTRKERGFFVSSVHIHAVTLRERRRPVFIQQIIVHVLHLLQLVGLEEVGETVGSLVLLQRIGILGSVVDAAVVVAVEHVGVHHGIHISHLCLIGDARLS